MYSGIRTRDLWLSKQAALFTALFKVIGTIYTDLHTTQIYPFRLGFVW